MVFAQALELEETTSIADILANPGDYDGKTVQVKGPIKASCTGMGCWMRLDAGDGQVLLVKSSDETVLVPTKDIVGRTALVEGVVVVEHDHGTSSQEEGTSSQEEAKTPTCAGASEEGHVCPQAKIRLETKGVVLL